MVMNLTGMPRMLADVAEEASELRAKMIKEDGRVN